MDHSAKKVGVEEERFSQRGGQNVNICSSACVWNWTVTAAIVWDLHGALNPELLSWFQTREDQLFNLLLFAVFKDCF